MKAFNGGSAAAIKIGPMQPVRAELDEGLGRNHKSTQLEWVKAVVDRSLAGIL
jgi:hypothetical protein